LIRFISTFQVQFNLQLNPIPCLVSKASRANPDLKLIQSEPIQSNQSQSEPILFDFDRARLEIGPIWLNLLQSDPILVDPVQAGLEKNPK